MTPLNYTPESFPRETKRHYISASDSEIDEMLKSIGLNDLKDLYSHLPEDVMFSEEPNLPEELEYNDIPEAIFNTLALNNIYPSFMGDGMPNWETHPIVPYVAGIRNLTTSYTAYQPERSQGSLYTLWIYQCVMAKLTGFEAINCSLYDRSTAIFEAISCAIRIKRKTNTVIVSNSIFAADIEVINTMASDTDLNIVYCPINESTGLIDLDQLKALATDAGSNLAAIAFPQTNTFGLLEDVDTLTNFAESIGVKSIAIIDPILLAEGGLKPPSEFGSKGADIIAGEGQHLAIGPNFGGPGLGVFGVRNNKDAKNDIRSTPGRFVGKAKDSKGKDCLVMVLSAREQHIRKEKATSNICSNQAYLATLVGASILAKGEKGLSENCIRAHKLARKITTELLQLSFVELAFPTSSFYNEVTFAVEGINMEGFIQQGSGAQLHIGVDLSSQDPLGRQLLKISFSDVQTDQDCDKLISFFQNKFELEQDKTIQVPAIPEALLRKGKTGLPNLEESELKSFYDELGTLNVSPDTTCYPLGSCTMKYNPYINDWAAGLPETTDVHPQSPVQDVQGSLKVLFETQEWFKKITGLAGVTTQPLAGAQGELVGLKLFQAYHNDNGDTERDVLLIPQSAHGTNFATATMAGFKNENKDGRQTGIILLESDNSGCVNLADLDAKLEEHKGHISGIMITNPNTGGVFEKDFKIISNKIHAAGGLVYMDGANMNAIAGWIDLNAIGVDAVHNNLHKTWSIPHGGGGPGDAIVAVSEKLIPFLPGKQITFENGKYAPITPTKTIGSIHRHWGNFAHKVRCYTYLLRLGKAGVPKMSAVAVLASRYLQNLLKDFPHLPKGSHSEPRMHEFILTLEEKEFETLEANGLAKTGAIPNIGKLFLDFGYHAPTVAFPEVFGLMIEPTESHTKGELDRLAEAILAIKKLITECPQAVVNAPHFTPVDKVDEVTANRNLILSEDLQTLPTLPSNRIRPEELQATPINEIYEKLLALYK